ncbi:hypothetical protein [Staphylococcus phage PT94]
MKMYEEYKANEEAVALQQYYEDFYDDFVVTEIDRQFTDKYFVIEGIHSGCYFKFQIYSYSVFNKKYDLNISYDEYVTSEVDKYISKVSEIQGKFTEKDEKEYHKFKNDALLDILERGCVVSDVLRIAGKTSTIKYYAEKRGLPILVPNETLKKFYKGYNVFTPEELLKRPYLLAGTYLLDDISEDDYYLLRSNPNQYFNFRMTGFIKPKNK